MIPKIIHYCWFGNNSKPQSVIECINSWKIRCPDFEIVEWNEDNFNLNLNPYVQEAYTQKKWAFVSDVARLYALQNYGGFYLDTDVEIISSLDGIASKKGAVLGFEAEERLSTAFLAGPQGHPLFKKLLEEYNSLHFVRADGSLDKTANVVRITSLCLKYGLKLNGSKQTLNDIYVYPRDYFSPMDYYTREIKLTNNTIAIHKFDGSWNTESDLYAAQINYKLSRILPGKLSKCTARFLATAKYDGIKSALNETMKWMKRNS